MDRDDYGTSEILIHETMFCFYFNNQLYQFFFHRNDYNDSIYRSLYCVNYGVILECNGEGFCVNEIVKYYKIMNIKCSCLIYAKLLIKMVPFESDFTSVDFMDISHQIKEEQDES